MANRRGSIGLGLKIGDRVWVKDDVHAWLHGTVISRDAKSISVRSEKGELSTFSVSDAAANLDLAGNHLEMQIDNLVELEELSEGAILHHVRKRFSGSVIYTHVGAILVAVNPFELLDIYGEAEMQRAMCSVKNGKFYPHVYVTAAQAYENLVANAKNQSVLISGESGAGKTETTKKVLTYLANCASSKTANALMIDDHQDDVSIEDKILQSNPLLEALGNAKTLRNNNSSRFGKWMKVDFDGMFKIKGSEIKNYLLEKSRVVYQSPDERNYHIFYQLVRGSDEPTRKKLFLGDVSSYRYISGCSVVSNVDDTKDFLDVLDALYTLQFPQTVVEAVFKVLSAVLSLGNVDFKPILNDSNDACEVDKVSVPMITNAASLLGVEATQLANCLKSKNVQVGKGSMVTIRLTASQATDFRDTLAKALYGNLFDWIVLRINDSLKTSNIKYSIGILDIFGFEVFDINSFEQLCINYANEKLQNHFNSVIFSAESKLYVDEGIPLENVHFVDNSGCVNLIEGKPFGLILLLDEECTLGNGSDLSYINKISKQFEKTSVYYQKHKTKPDKFSVMHFAGPVEYTVTNFLEKNRDTLSATCKEAMLQSTVPLITGLFSDSLAEVGLSSSSPDKRGSSTLKSAIIKSKDQKTNKVTLGSQFRNQLIGLINMINDTEPHFIRCVKPNHQKVGRLFDGQLALRQLRYAGLFEAIRIRKAGFSFRMPFNAFANIYERIVNGLAKRRADNTISDKESCGLIIEEAMRDSSIEEGCAFIGVTKVFMKSNNDRVALDRLRAGAVIVFVVRLQRLARAYIRRIRSNRERYERDKKRLAEERRRREEEARVAEIKRVERERVEAIQREEDERRRKIYEQHSAKCVIVQKYWRRHAVKLSLPALEAYKLVKFAKTCKLSADVFTLLQEIDMIPVKFYSSVKMLRSSFYREKKEMQALSNLLERQEMFISDMDLAISNGDVVAVNSLLDSVGDFGLADHGIVVYAKKELKRLHHKYEIMKIMMHFMKTQDLDSLEGISGLLEEARSVGIDGEFITRTERLYDNLGPKLRLKMLLRSAIEHVHRVRIEALMKELEMIRSTPRDCNYADVEYRAAKQMLALLQFEKTLYPYKHDIGSLDWVFEDNDRDAHNDDWDNEARLNGTIISLCDAISSTDSGEELFSKQLLEEYCCYDRYKFQKILRAYKWSALLCQWKLAREKECGAGDAEEKSSDLEQQQESPATGSPGTSPTGSPERRSSPTKLVSRGSREVVFYNLNVTRAREVIENQFYKGNGAIFRHAFEQTTLRRRDELGSGDGDVVYDQVPLKTDDVFRNLSKAFGRDDDTRPQVSSPDGGKGAAKIKPSELVSGSYIKDYIFGLKGPPGRGSPEARSPGKGSPQKGSPSKSKAGVPVSGVSPEKRFYLSVGGVQTAVRAAYTIGGTHANESSPIGALGVTRELEEKLYSSRKSLEATRAQKNKLANASPEKRSPEKGLRI